MSISRYGVTTDGVRYGTRRGATSGERRAAAGYVDRLYESDPFATFDDVYCPSTVAKCRETRMPDPKYAAYEAAQPYFDLVRGALGELVDGEHFFDVVAEDLIYEVLYDFPGWPRITQGRAHLMAQFRGYGDHIALQSADKLMTHKTDDGRVVVLEYEVHGTILATGVKYDNRFCSIIKIEGRKIAHWRDYMDSLAAWNALMPRARQATDARA
jgi:ketosteroid isomerase-like protein